jgi:hypothetical protein
MKEKPVKSGIAKTLANKLRNNIIRRPITTRAVCCCVYISSDRYDIQFFKVTLNY